MPKVVKILVICELANLKTSTSTTFYVYQDHFSADTQLVSCTQIDIFEFKIKKCTC